MARDPQRELPEIRPHAAQPDAYFRLLVESVQDYAIFLLDPQGRISSWNPGAQRLKGYTPEQAIGQHYRMFYPDAERASGRPERQLEEAARTGRVEGRGWRLRRDGSRFWAHVVITALFDGDRLVGFAKVTADLTDLRGALEELRSRERQLAEAQQIAHVGSWEWNRHTGALRWSDEMYRIYGREPGTPVDYPGYIDAIHPDDRDRVLAAVDHAIATGTALVHEHRVVTPDGVERWVQGRGEVLRDEQGRMVGLHGTALDITELKVAEERTRRLSAEQIARAEAERTAQRMGFLAEASALVGASLEFEETLSTIAWLAVPSFADWCVVDMVNPDGDLDRLAVAHIDPDRVALARQIDERYPPEPDAEHGPRAVLRSGKPELAPEIPPALLDELAHDDSHRRLIRDLGLRSYISVPIRVRDRALGVITFMNAESDRSYGTDDLIVAEELAGRAALAIENTQLHAAEREARRRAEEAKERITRLQSITAELSEAVTPEAVASVIVDAGMAALDANSGSLILASGDPPSFRIVRSVGVPQKVVDRYRVFGPDAHAPLASAVRLGEVVLVESTRELAKRFPDLADTLAERTTVGALSAVPLRSGDRILGGLGFTYPTPRDFTSEDREFLLAIGRQCVQALERARLYETEHAARQAAEAASQAKSQFVAMMSHELRTPLAAIIGYQELLSEEIVGPVNEKQKDQLSRIRASATHLRDLINQILSLSRIEAGKEEVFRESVDLAELTRDVALLMEREVEAKGLVFRVDIPEGEVEGSTDAGKVRQILLNLISNAIKFTEDGEIAVRFTVDGDRVEVQVSDTGIGISAEDQERVFDAFTQVDQSMTRRAGGTGLGLPVSRHLARLLGGGLALDSDAERGSTFTLTLPLVAPDVPLPADQAEPGGDAAPSEDAEAREGASEAAARAGRSR